MQSLRSRGTNALMCKQLQFANNKYVRRTVLVVAAHVTDPRATHTGHRGNCGADAAMDNVNIALGGIIALVAVRIGKHVGSKRV